VKKKRKEHLATPKKLTKNLEDVEKEREKIVI